MIDYYLKFSSQEEALQELKKAGYTAKDENENDFVISATHEYCVDLVGDIYKGGKWESTEEGEILVIEEPVKLEGYHVNVRILSGDIAENLKDFAINTPRTPIRIFG
jgi:autonomous glycyl radical cofactor GrcA